MEIYISLGYLSIFTSSRSFPSYCFIYFVQGACSVVGLATVFEDDYKSELDTSVDPTLESTHLDQSSAIATGIVQWGICIHTSNFE